MKNKYLILIIGTVFLGSCATKPTVPVVVANVATPKAEIVEVVKPAPTDSPVVNFATVPMLPMAENIDIATGKSLYENNCGGCHKLYVAKEFSKEDWLPILKRMQKKTDLNNDNMAIIKAYIFSEL